MSSSFSKWDVVCRGAGVPGTSEPGDAGEEGGNYPLPFSLSGERERSVHPVQSALVPSSGASVVPGLLTVPGLESA